MRNLKHIQPLGVDCLDPWAEPPSTHQFDFHAFKARKRQAIQPQCRPSRSRQRQRPTWPRVATEAVISGGQTRPTSTPMRFGMCATHWRAKQNKAAL